MPAGRTEPRAPAKTRILLVDDHALLRRGLATLIESEPDLLVCAEAETRQAGLDAVASSRPDLVIADLALRYSDGLELIKDIKRHHPDLPVLALSMHDEVIYAERAIRAGARGYVCKQEVGRTVLTAIRSILAGNTHISEALSSHFTRKYMEGDTLEKVADLGRLTDRELEVFKLIGQGKKTTEIAETLSLSVKTIETYRERLRAKLHLPSGIELLRCATLWVETGHIP